MNRFVPLLVLAAACGSPSASPGPDAPEPGPGDAAPPDAAMNAVDPFEKLGDLPATCSNDHWCWRMPAPTGNDYTKIYATAPDNLWLIGQHGVVMQWNGTTWRLHHPPQPSGQSTAVIAYGISGRSPDDMWLLIGSTVQHWDGATWTIRDSLPPNGLESFDSIWEAPNGDVWVTLNTGSVSRALSGAAFVRIDTGCNCFLGSIWGTAPDDFWMTSLPGNIMHFDGHMFTTAYRGTSPIGSFVGTTKDDVWVSGADGTLLHWNGSTWTTVKTGLGSGFLGAATALAHDDVWWWWASNSSASSAFVHWDGSMLSTAPVDTSALGTFLFSAAIIDGRWWLVGGAGAVYTKTSANTIKPIVNPHVTNLESMWGAADDDLYFATGGQILKWDGATLTPLQPVIGASAISGIHTSSGDELFGVGFEETSDHTGYIADAYHYDGASWSKAQLDRSTISEHRYFTQVWAIAPGEAMAVGYGGIAYHYANGVWHPVATGVATDLMGIWGPDPDHLWLSGAHGTLLQWNRASPDIATPDPTLSTTDDLGAIHGAGGLVWIAAGSAAVLKGTASGWTKITTNISVDAIFAVDDKNVVIASRTQSQIARWNGSAFVLEDNAAAAPTPVLFQPPGGKMLAGGLKTLVQHP
jgi:hypothetical protein